MPTPSGCLMDYFCQQLFRSSAEKPSCNKKSGLCLDVPCWRQLADVWLDLTICRCSGSLVEYFVRPALSIYKYEEFRKAEFELSQHLKESESMSSKHNNIYPNLTTEWISVRCRELLDGVLGEKGINLRKMGRLYSVSFQLKNRGMQTQRLVIAGLEENAQNAKKMLIEELFKLYVHNEAYRMECERQLPSVMMDLNRSDFYIPRELIGLLLDSPRKVLGAIESQFKCIIESRHLSAENSDNIFLRVTASSSSIIQVAGAVNVILKYATDRNDIFQLTHLEFDGCHFWVLNHALEKPIDAAALAYFNRTMARMTQGSHIVEEKRIEELRLLYDYLLGLEQQEKPKPKLPPLPPLSSLRESQVNNYSRNGYSLSPYSKLTVESPKLDASFGYGSTVSVESGSYQGSESVVVAPPNQDPFLNFAHTSDSSPETTSLSSPVGPVEHDSYDSSLFNDTSCNSLKRTYFSSFSSE